MYWKTNFSFYKFLSLTADFPVLLIIGKTQYNGFTVLAVGVAKAVIAVFCLITYFICLSGKYSLQVFTLTQIGRIKILRFADCFFIAIPSDDKIIIVACSLSIGGLLINPA